MACAAGQEQGPSRAVLSWSKDLVVKWKKKPHCPVQTKRLLARRQAGGAATAWQGAAAGGGEHREEARGRDAAPEGLKVSFPPNIRCVPILPAMCLKSLLLSPENIYSTRR